MTVCIDFLTINLYKAIPRLKLRKRSASESLRPLLIDISQAIEQAAPYANPSQSATMMHLIRDVLYCALSWAQNRDNPSDIPVFKVSVICVRCVYIFN